MNSTLKIFIAAVTVLAYLTGGATARMCYGSASAVQGYAAMCPTMSGSFNFANSQSCLFPLLAQSSVPTCTTAGKCTEINIKVKAGYFSDTDNKMWSVAACFGQNMDVLICTSDPTVTTAAPSTTAAPTTTTATTSTTEPTTSTAAATTTTVSTVSTTEASTTTAATTSAAATTTAPDSTTNPTTSPTTTAASTTQASTSTTAAPTTTASTSVATSTSEAPTTSDGGTTSGPTLPTFTGCIEATLTWAAATCGAEADQTFDAKWYDDVDKAAATETDIKIVASVLECCDTDNCRIDDGVQRDRTCNFGNSTSVSDVSCAGECYTYFSDPKEGDAVALHGCLADLPLSDTSFSGVTSCSTTYKDGSCQDASGDTECLKCCDTDNCNTWNTKDSLLGTKDDDDDDSASATLTSTLFLIVTAYIVNLL